MNIEKNISGVQKAAILMMALGEDNCSRLFEQMHEEEIREISSAMAQLGMISATLVERVCHEFSQGLGSAEGLIGDLESTEKLLKNALPANRAAAIMEEIRGPAGRTMWDKLGNVSETVLANYLKNEYPQTVAVVLSRVKPAHAAKVLALFTEDFSLDIMMRMLKTENIHKNILQNIEKTLRSEFVSNIPRGINRNSHEVLAEIFNNFDRRLEGRFMNALDERSHEDAEQIKSLMFTFEELVNLSAESLIILLNQISRESLPLALKGASDKLRQAFFASMSERAGRILLDEIGDLGPVRVKDVDTAQNEILIIAKDLIERGEIDIIDHEQPGNEMIV
ncbi:flagellar motor switch protein FliG [Gluconobacter kanchanaburiensis]|uniref:Flagellar motor switch protein FliG n=1 Tax=Gluconobacter kanchanaburiensis NBRC 103587 TaxID=1307948 RepID=A0A511B9H7_9PROT|nr:flagellar motor switch protein FliG [Gluconobacter kanchanaburiensis]GBR70408.1 flagellar motor switch protein G [Gluconobacter kanchanaburiensis NBRC 103587]GEK97095.1 flagellar motor switch protein FliG [Gluconobacter kanchanaburiensis NBRC 103587]